MKRRRIRRSATAMTDIAFLLLLFFLVMAIVGFRTPVAIDPPDARSGSLIRHGADRKLYITEDGTLYDGNGPVSMAQLASEIASAMAVDAEIIITADRNTQFQDIIPVIDLLQEHGVPQVGFAVETPMEDRW